MQANHYEVTYKVTVSTPMGHVSEERIKAALDEALREEMAKQRGVAWPGHIEIKPMPPD
jgi:hypothetical protein